MPTSHSWQGLVLIPSGFKLDSRADLVLLTVAISTTKDTRWPPGWAASLACWSEWGEIRQDNTRAERWVLCQLSMLNLCATVRSTPTQRTRSTRFAYKASRCVLGAFIFRELMHHDGVTHCHLNAVTMKSEAVGLINDNNGQVNKT